MEAKSYGKAVHQDRENILGLNQAPVEKSKTGRVIKRTKAVAVIIQAVLPG